MQTIDPRRERKEVLEFCLLHALEDALSIALTCATYCGHKKQSQWYAEIKAIWEEVRHARGYE